MTDGPKPTRSHRKGPGKPKFYSRAWRSFQAWRMGVYVPPPSNDPTSPLVFISVGRYERPYLARAMDAVVAFFAREWKWLIGVGLTLIGLFVAIAKTFAK